MPLKTVKVQTMYAYKRGMPLPKQQMEFQALLSLLGKSFELCCVCLVMGWCGACWACVSLYRAAEGKSCTLLRYCYMPRAWAAAGLCQLHYGLVFSEGFFLIIGQLLMCLKEGIDFEMTPAPFLPCVFLGAWQKGSYWCSGEKKRVMDWKSVYFTLKSSSTRFWVVFKKKKKKKSINAT